MSVVWIPELPVPLDLFVGPKALTEQIAYIRISLNNSLKEAVLSLKLMTSEEFDNKVRPEREYTLFIFMVYGLIFGIHERKLTKRLDSWNSYDLP